MASHLSNHPFGNTGSFSTTMSGKTYSNKAAVAPNLSAWMELSVFDDIPTVQSLAASSTYRRETPASLSNASLMLTGNDANPALTTVSYDIHTMRSTTSTTTAMSEKSWASYEMPARKEPKATFRIKFELYAAECPNLVENFIHLCAGTPPRSVAQVTAPLYEGQHVNLSYRGTYFHKIIPKFVAQGGDLTYRVNGGANHFSAFGRGPLNDENLKRPFDQAGLLGMANNGPNTNGSQFFITTAKAGAEEKALNGRHCCIGRVVEGLEQFLALVGPSGSDKGQPTKFVMVTDCGSDFAPSRD